MLRVCDQLRREGWDFVAISVCKLVVDGENAATPGASRLDADPSRVGPALPREADTLRHLADLLDQSFAEIGVPEATEGWREEVPPSELEQQRLRARGGVA